MTEDRWQLAPEVVASAARARAGERERSVAVFAVLGALLGLLLLILLGLWIEGPGTQARDIGTVVGLFGAFLATDVAFAWRALMELRRLRGIAATTTDPRIGWFLADHRIVASRDGRTVDALAFAIPPRTRAELVAVPRARVVSSSATDPGLKKPTHAADTADSS